jgi:hypothetical protein
MINRWTTRTVLNTTETTAKTKSVESDALAFALTTADYFYLGFKQPFTTRYFHFAQPNTNACTLTVEFWNANAWKAVEDLVDETNGFTKSGYVSWLNFGTWFYKQESPVSAVAPENGLQLDLMYYWIRIKVSANLSAGTLLQSVTNLFCNETLFSVYYPELLSDARYLPPGQTDFMPQFFAATQHVVKRLRQMAKIDDEGQILDINDVAVAACHATAYVILNPLARDQESKDVAKAAFKECEDELSRTTMSVDENKDGRIDATEKFSGTTFLSR